MAQPFNFFAESGPAEKFIQTNKRNWRNEKCINRKTNGELFRNKAQIFRQIQLSPLRGARHCINLFCQADCCVDGGGSSGGGLHIIHQIFLSCNWCKTTASRSSWNELRSQITIHIDIASARYATVLCACAEHLMFFVSQWRVPKGWLSYEWRCQW